MIPNSRAFDDKEFFEHDGIVYYRWHYLKKTGDYKLRFKILSTNSSNKQGIALFFSDFVGTLSVNNQRLKPLKHFEHYVFEEGIVSNNEFVFDVHVEKGYMFFGNASEEHGLMRCGAFGCAHWIEIISENHFRFHCNDHEYDDDFDDMIFDMEYIV